MFLTFIAKIDQFRQVSSLATWIHRIAVNAAPMRKRCHKIADLSLDDLALPALPLERLADDLVCRARRTAPCAANPGRCSRRPLTGSIASTARSSSCARSKNFPAPPPRTSSTSVPRRQKRACTGHGSFSALSWQPISAPKPAAPATPTPVDPQKRADTLSTAGERRKKGTGPNCRTEIGLLAALEYG